MDLSSIIDDIASQADDFLAGAADRKEARAGITELINADYPELKPADRKQVAEAVMAIREEEDFFNADRTGRNAGDDANGECGSEALFNP
jgi:hypothetical protein